MLQWVENEPGLTQAEFVEVGFDKLSLRKYYELFSEEPPSLLSGKNGSSSPLETAMRLDPLG